MDVVEEATDVVEAAALVPETVAAASLLAVEAAEAVLLAGASTDAAEDAESAADEVSLVPAAAYTQVVIAIVAVNARTAVKIFFFINFSSNT